MDSFAALAEPNRRRMMEMLSVRGSLSASEIGSRFKISAPAVSQHLKVLREAGLVRVEKKAQQRIYSADPRGMEEMGAWVDRMRQFWNLRLDALETALENDTKKGKKA
jgi:DNA-binding transcriptional ArsR family regulator